MGRYLNPNADWLQLRPLTIVIYWRPKRGIEALQNGHAALIIDSQQFNLLAPDYYVSWLGSGGRNPFVATAQASTFHSDMADWGGHPVPNLPGFHVPTRWVAVSSLHTGRMKAAWDAMRTKQGAHWKLFDKNCATTVARILKAGGGDVMATSHRTQKVWWPSDLIKYARSMPTVVDRSDHDVAVAV